MPPNVLPAACSIRKHPCPKPINSSVPERPSLPLRFWMPRLIPARRPSPQQRGQNNNQNQIPFFGPFRFPSHRPIRIPYPECPELVVLENPISRNKMIRVESCRILNLIADYARRSGANVCVACSSAWRGGDGCRAGYADSLDRAFRVKSRAEIHS
ncbi:hypothetical protein VTJ04DRAFT_1831 [Mycothermus thermophilus]|uniref:uncharacterized protein n=1 Tax=Humicola insolens TaxID=85995 RepID=UPI003743E6B4